MQKQQTPTTPSKPVARTIPLPSKKKPSTLVGATGGQRPVPGSTLRPPLRPPVVSSATSGTLSAKPILQTKGGGTGVPPLRKPVGSSVGSNPSAGVSTTANKSGPTRTTVSGGILKGSSSSSSTSTVAATGGGTTTKTPVTTSSVIPNTRPPLIPKSKGIPGQRPSTPLVGSGSPKVVTKTSTTSPGVVSPPLASTQKKSASNASVTAVGVNSTTTESKSDTSLVGQSKATQSLSIAGANNAPATSNDASAASPPPLLTGIKRKLDSLLQDEKKEEEVSLGGDGGVAVRETTAATPTRVQEGPALKRAKPNAHPPFLKYILEAVMMGDVWDANDQGLTAAQVNMVECVRAFNNTARSKGCDIDVFLANFVKIFLTESEGDMTRLSEQDYLTPIYNSFTTDYKPAHHKPSPLSKTSNIRRSATQLQDMLLTPCKLITLVVLICEILRGAGFVVAVPDTQMVDAISGVISSLVSQMEMTVFEETLSEETGAKLQWSEDGDEDMEVAESTALESTKGGVPKKPGSSKSSSKKPRTQSQQAPPATSDKKKKQSASTPATPPSKTKSGTTTTSRKKKKEDENSSEASVTTSTATPAARRSRSNSKKDWILIAVDGQDVIELEPTEKLELASGMIERSNVCYIVIEEENPEDENEIFIRWFYAIDVIKTTKKQKGDGVQKHHLIKLNAKQVQSLGLEFNVAKHFNVDVRGLKKLDPNLIEEELTKTERIYLRYKEAGASEVGEEILKGKRKAINVPLYPENALPNKYRNKHYSLTCRYIDFSTKAQYSCLLSVDRETTGLPFLLKQPSSSSSSSSSGGKKGSTNKHQKEVKQPTPVKKTAKKKDVVASKKKAVAPPPTPGKKVTTLKKTIATPTAPSSRHHSKKPASTAKVVQKGKRAVEEDAEEEEEQFASQDGLSSTVDFVEEDEEGDNGASAREEEEEAWEGDEHDEDVQETGDWDVGSADICSDTDGNVRSERNEEEEEEEEEGYGNCAGAEPMDQEYEEGFEELTEGQDLEPELEPEEEGIESDSQVAELLEALEGGLSDEDDCDDDEEEDDEDEEGEDSGAAEESKEANEAEEAEEGEEGSEEDDSEN